VGIGNGALGIPSLRDATRTASLRASGHWALGIKLIRKLGFNPLIYKAFRLIRMSIGNCSFFLFPMPHSQFPIPNLFLTFQIWAYFCPNKYTSNVVVTIVLVS
jgi:hypothetical protein